jgi:hypothetical protein
MLHGYWGDKIPSDDEIYELILGLPREDFDIHIKGTQKGAIPIRDILASLKGITREMLTRSLLRLQARELIKVMSNPAYVFVV